jgi:hypothetical protein
MSKPIEGRVSAVLNVREIAINRGLKHGVSTGMILAVLAEAPFEITDPDTGTVIGVLDREKVRVRVTEVGPEFAIASTFKTYRTGYDLSSLFSPLFAQGAKERVQTLRVEDSELPRPLPEDQSFVKRGDRVRQVIEPKTETE